MLDYMDFRAELKAGVALRMGKEYRIDTRKIGKVNRGLLDAMSVLDTGDSGDLAAPTFYPELLYQRYREGAGVEEIAEEIAGICLEGRKETEEAAKQASDIGDYEKMKGRLYFRLINTEKNRKLLDSMPHFKVLDLSMVFYVLLSEDESGTGSVPVNSRLLELWGIAPEELRKEAERNTPKMFPVELKPISHIMQMILNGISETGENSERGGDFPWEKESEGPFILTNDRMRNGFAAVLYPGVLKDMADMLGKDLYILPSSLHEALLLLADSLTKPGELRDMVREVNASVVAEEDILSDSVYYYDRIEDTLKIPGEEK